MLEPVRLAKPLGKDFESLLMGLHKNKQEWNTEPVKACPDLEQ